MWVRRKICSIPGHRMAVLVTLIFLLLSVNGLLISIWCSWTVPLKTSVNFTTRTFRKLQVNKFHKPRFSYEPDLFFRMDERLKFPITNEKKPEPIACDDYLGMPDELQLNDKDHWRFIDEGRHNETYVYSAYYDSRLDPPSIKIFGMSSGVTLDVNPVPGLKYCYVWFKGLTKPDVMVSNYEVIPETHGRIYAASIYHCILQRNATPIAVALSMYKCKRQNHFLRVSKPYENKPTHNFTVCVTPISFGFNNAIQLIEMIEINKIFGADHFTFYNYSIGPLVSKVLERYSSEGLVEVLPWDVPVNVDTSPSDPTVEVEIHYFAQLVSLNECLYRNMFKSKFVVFSDLDELIVPQMHDTWFDMIRHATAEAEADLIFLRNVESSEIFPSSFLIRNIFFPLQWKGNDFDKLPHNRKRLQKLQRSSNFTASKIKTAIRYRMNSILVTRCESQSYNWFIRSKYIVWSKVVETLAIHQVHTFLSPNANWQVQVKEHVGLLHHYRKWSDGKYENSSRSCTRLHHFIPNYFSSVMTKLDSL